MKIEFKQSRVAFTNKEWAVRMVLLIIGMAVLANALALSDYHFPDWQYIYLLVSYPLFYVILRLNRHIEKVARIRQDNERKGERL